jgi:hypothetical protein
MSVKGAVKLYKSFRERNPKRIGKIDFKVPVAVACIGYVEGIDYKTTHGKKVTLYHHDFAAGSRPLLAVSADGKQLLLLGGRYQFTERGIVDRDAAGDEIENAGHGKYINPRLTPAQLGFRNGRRGQTSQTVPDEWTEKQHDAYGNNWKRGYDIYTRERSSGMKRKRRNPKAVDEYITGLTQHLKNNAENIAREAAAYAKKHGMPVAQARAEVSDAYAEGYYEALEQQRYGNPGKLRQKEVFAELRAMGLSPKKTGYDNEIRVAYADLKGESQEASAYYTDDLGDALGTGRAMIAQRNR